METGGTAALALCGASKTSALAFVFAYHVTQLVPALVAGVAILVAEGELLFGRGGVPEAETIPGSGGQKEA